MSSKAPPSWLKSFATKKKPKLEPKPAGTSAEAAVRVDASGMDDYMAAEVLEDAANHDEELQRKKREIRALEKPEPLRPLKERMKEELEKGLKSEIDQSNIGFKMMAKMGFEKGKGIGKDSLGSLNPLGIHVRAGARAGLGKEEEVHRVAEEQFQRQAAEATEMRATFLARQRTNFETKLVLREVVKGRKVCEALDRALGLQYPHLWPEVPPEKTLFTDPDTGEQVFTAPNGQTYSRPIHNSHDDREENRASGKGHAGGGRGEEVFFGDSDRSAEELVVIRDDIVRHLREMHR